MPHRGWSAVLALAAAACPAAAADKPSPDGVEFFEKKIRPLFVKHCHECHSADAKKVKGDFRLDTRDALLKGGPSGPGVAPGDPAKSLIVQAVKHEGDVAEMPPKGKLSAAEIADLEVWVKMGAPDPRAAPATTGGAMTLAQAREFWAFKPVVRPSVPEVRSAEFGVRNPIDAFVRAKLAEKGLTPSPPADKRTLIRRATFDLTGLPPTPEEVEAFVADRSPDAFEKVVDRLLASPAYGERWGRHWMDVVRYADTAGDNSDYPVPQIRLYRDWVIAAFNRDLPYDEFVRQQLAGDLMPSADEADRRNKLIATGYLANARRFGSYEDARYPWYLTYEDTIDNLGRTFLALTVNCCRCHDHKFDPLSQADYYALYGFFSSTRYPRPGIELDKVQRDFVPLAPAAEVAGVQAERDRNLAAFDVQIQAVEAERKTTEKELTAAAKLPDEAERAAKVAELNRRMDALKAKVKKAQTEKEAVGKQPLPYPTAYAVAEGKTEGKKKVGNACIQIKGDPERPGAEVPRRFPTVLGGQTLAADAKGSGRLELANWIADPKNPLTARVIVNRVWHYHFGKGIVPTPGNFGALGRAPTHPELLDWLTSEFVSPTKPTDGRPWALKQLHKLIMLSATYQQSSADDPANAAKDVANDYLWRFDRRRLDAEAIRDAMLAVSGSLDRTPAGPHPFPDPTKWNFTQHNPFKAVYESEQRSVYLMTQRIQRHPFLALFDGPDTNAGTANRVTSTTPLQALYLMNDPFVHARAKGLAARLLRELPDDAARVDRAYRLLFARPSADAEASAAREYLSRVREKAAGDAAWESLARALLLSNEFVYTE